MTAMTDALFTEAADKIDELRRERDSARQNAADLLAALSAEQALCGELIQAVADAILGDREGWRERAQALLTRIRTA